MLILVQVFLIFICVFFGLASCSPKEEHKNLIKSYQVIFTVSMASLMATFMI